MRKLDNEMRSLFTDAMQADDMDGRTARRRAVRKTASKRASKSTATPAGVEPKVLAYLRKHGDSYVWQIAPAIGMTEADAGKLLRSMARTHTICEVEPQCYSINC